jgi:[glutamine synthetase] adenylyltransferase / [glutamine synthetase]-adenylyl-L-tyrosine phosphorylase
MENLPSNQPKTTEPTDNPMNDTFAALNSLSAYAARNLQASPTIAALVQEISNAPIDETIIRALWARQLQSDYTLEKNLRQWRNVIMIALAQRSLTGHADLAEVVQSISATAKIAIQVAIDYSASAMQADFGVPLDSKGAPQDLLVMGMGKLGANELNISSDIDLILLYREQGLSSGSANLGSQIAASEYFARLVKIMVPLIEQLTADGFVFRVDLRLRPHGDSGPIAVSLNYLEDYLVSEGRVWERFAWLKAALVATTQFSSPSDQRIDLANVNAIIEPFVYRRYLDYSAIASLRDLHGLIQNEQHQKNRHRTIDEGCDVKLGRGGIREIEFCVQLLQIIRAGRDASLRERSTLGALAKLKKAEVLNTKDADALASAYHFLRRIEHAIQWREDQQTHWLGFQNPQQLTQVAGLMQLQSSQLLEELNQTRKTVSEIFDQLLAHPASNKSDLTSKNIGASEPEKSEDTLSSYEQAFFEGSKFSRASEPIQNSVRQLIASSKLNSATQTLNATTLQRLIDLIERLIGRPGYIALLAQYPKALQRLVSLLNYSQWAAQFITRYPIVIDELVSDPAIQNNQNKFLASNWPRLSESLRQQLEHSDTERQLDALREFHHGQILRLMLLELEGQLSVAALADELSALADVVIEQTIHCIEPNAGLFAVIAYGKLGGKELGYASDLDIVFIYDEQGFEALKKGVPAQEFYARLARKLMQWLTVKTGAGELFEVDIRLRPDGDSGLLVSNISSFEDYQKNHAWLWEHQALTRARFCAGNPTLGERFEAIRLEMLRLPRAQAATQIEIAQMRDKVIAGHPNRTELFDLKHDSGGMVDLEFSVQCLILQYASQHPVLCENVGNLALLKVCGEQGLITPALADQCIAIYQDLRRTQYALRLNGHQQTRVPPEQWAPRRALVKQLWAEVFCKLEQPTSTTRPELKSN